jgi:serine/threonine protein kinase
VVGRLPYDEAMTFSAVRLKIQDPELRQGKVETAILQTNAGPVERPWGIEGGFAVVYKFRTRSGQFRALRCFRVPMSSDMQFRYEQIGPYFHAHIPTITAGFKYHAQGITVKESGQARGETYPIIEMDWIEGVTLIDKLHELCNKRDRITLKALSEQWLSVLEDLRKAGIAHGDLAGQNVMVRPDGHMVLVDYDGVYIPGFANLEQVLVGQPDYQHPHASQRKFNEHMDAFSALVIYIVLLALSIRPELWLTYTRLGDKGEPLDTNLLFKDQDFQAPQRSPLFKDLEQLNDQRVRTLVQALKQACAQPVEQVRFPLHLLDPDYEKRQALELLTQAIITGDDELIAAGWTTPLEHYPPAQKQRSRVQLAQQRLNALARFRAAIQTRKLVQIVTGYDAILDNCKNVTRHERRLLELARKFLQAYREHNDDALLASSVELQGLTPGILFTQQQHDLALARKRKGIRQRLAKARKSKDVEQIAALHQDVQLIQSEVQAAEQRRIDLAFGFMRAYASDDDGKICAAAAAIEQSVPDLIFGSHLRKRITLAQQRLELARRQQEALARLRDALRTRRLRAIASAYDPILDNYAAITQREHAFIKIARDFVQVYDKNDDDALHAAYSSLHNAYHDLFLFTQEEQERADAVERRLHRLQIFRAALNSKQPREIVDVYDKLAPLLTKQHGIPVEQRELVQVARNFLHCWHEQDDDRLLAAYEETQKPEYRGRLTFSQEQQDRIVKAQERAARLRSFKEALADGDAEQIVAAYKLLAGDIRSRLTDEQRKQAEAASAYCAEYERFVEARKGKDIAEARRIYKDICSNALFKPDPADKAYIQQMQQAQRVEDALHTRDREQAIRLGRSLEEQGGDLLDGLQWGLNKALQRYIRSCELEDVIAYIKAERTHNSLYVSWRWPQDDQVKAAVIIYSVHDYPPRFSDFDAINKDEFPCERQSVRRKTHESVGDVEINAYEFRRASTIYLRVCSGALEFWGRGNHGPHKKIFLSNGIKLAVHLSMPTTSRGR